MGVIRNTMATEIEGVIILSRLWRFVRIAHGLGATVVEAEHEAHKAHHKEGGAHAPQGA